MVASAKKDLLTRFKNECAALGLFEPGWPLLVMVSGGSDSVALLHLIVSTANSVQENSSSSFLTAHNLHVLHINHQLRSTAADCDEQFVKDLCASLGVGCTAIGVDVAAEAAKTGEGTEQAGRKIRYKLAEAALDTLISELGADPSTGNILTAHTADDRAETFLQRLIVGGGGSSLASIPKRNGKVVRPLLEYTRAELQDWLTTCTEALDGQYWREDVTNHDTRLSRAYVRHELLPLLAKRNPRIIQSLNRTADVLSSESTWMDEQARKLLPLTPHSFTAPEPLLRRAIYLACNEAIVEFAPTARITFEHIDFIASEGSRPGFACQIPGGIEVRHKYGMLNFRKAKPPKHTSPRKT